MSQTKIEYLLKSLCNQLL